MFLFRSSAFSALLPSLRAAIGPNALVRVARSSGTGASLAKGNGDGWLKFPRGEGFSSAVMHLPKNDMAARLSDVEKRGGVRNGAAVGLCAAICGLGYACGGSEPGSATTALSAAAILNGAILIHEAGHLAAARALGVAVREFSVGVGPRVAWWQGASSGVTYSLRALPLFGYVSFLTAAQLAKQESGGGSSGSSSFHRPAGHYRPPPRLLEHLPPGQRAVVLVAGVVANALLAAALVTWQVCEYGQIETVVRPGALVRKVESLQVDGSEQGGGQVPSSAAAAGGAAAAAGCSTARLRAGDVVVSVDGITLPAGAEMDVAIVEALRAALARRKSAVDALEAESQTAAAAAAAEGSCRGGSGGGDGSGRGGSGSGDGSGSSGDLLSAVEATRDLVGGKIQMTVLRSNTATAGDGDGSHSAGGAARMAALGTTAAAAAAVSGAAGGGGGGGGGERAAAGGRKEVVVMDAMDLVRYDTLIVAPNLALGCRKPRSLMEATDALGSELIQWMSLILSGWSQALGLSTKPAASSAALAAAAASTPSQSHSSGTGSATRSDVSSCNSCSTTTSTTTAAAAAAAAPSGSGCSGVSDPSSCSSSCSGGDASSSGGGGGAGGGGSEGAKMVGPLGLVAHVTESVAAQQQSREQLSSAVVGPFDFRDESLRLPPMMLELGIQLNLQLALVNLLPVPVLDGGKLVLVALEALRGGRALPVSLERAALLSSAAVVGGYSLALCLNDVVGLMDRAARRLAAAVAQPTAATSHPNHQLPPGQLSSDAAAVDGPGPGGDVRVVVVQVSAAAAARGSRPVGHQADSGAGSGAGEYGLAPPSPASAVGWAA